MNGFRGINISFNDQGFSKYDFKVTPLQYINRPDSCNSRITASNEFTVGIFFNQFQGLFSLRLLIGLAGKWRGEEALVR